MTNLTVEQHKKIVQGMIFTSRPRNGLASEHDEYEADQDAAFESLTALARLAADTERLREALEACYADLLRYAPAHWRNQGKGEILARVALASPPADPCWCSEDGVSPLRGHADDHVLAPPADTEQPTCDEDVWDGPYKMRCGRFLDRDGRCSRHFLTSQSADTERT